MTLWRHLCASSNKCFRPLPLKPKPKFLIRNCVHLSPVQVSQSGGSIVNRPFCFLRTGCGPECDVFDPIAAEANIGAGFITAFVTDGGRRTRDFWAFKRGGPCRGVRLTVERPLGMLGGPRDGATRDFLFSLEPNMGGPAIFAIEGDGFAVDDLDVPAIRVEDVSVGGFFRLICKKESGKLSGPDIDFLQFLVYLSLPNKEGGND